MVNKFGAQRRLNGNTGKLIVTAILDDNELTLTQDDIHTEHGHQSVTLDRFQIVKLKQLLDIWDEDNSL